MKYRRLNVLNVESIVNFLKSMYPCDSKGVCAIGTYLWMTKMYVKQHSISENCEKGIY